MGRQPWRKWGGSVGGGSVGVEVWLVWRYGYCARCRRQACVCHHVHIVSPDNEQCHRMFVHTNMAQRSSKRRNAALQWLIHYAKGNNSRFFFFNATSDKVREEALLIYCNVYGVEASTALESLGVPSHPKIIDQLRLLRRLQTKHQPLERIP